MNVFFVRASNCSAGDEVIVVVRLAVVCVTFFVVIIESFWSAGIVEWTICGDIVW